MKKAILILSGAIFFCASIAGEATRKGAGQIVPPQLKGSVTVSCSPELINLTQDWADEFIKANPGVRMNVVKLIPGEKIFGSSRNADLAIVSPGQADETETNGLWKMAVCRDIVVPVVSSSNPFLKDINSLGIRSSQLAGLLTGGKATTWGDLTGGNHHNPVNLLFADDPSVSSALSRFLGIEPGKMSGIQVSNVADLPGIIEKDPYAIGFCLLTDILGPNMAGLQSMLSLLPIDKNNNGKVDSFEQIYGNVADFMRGVWIGKYPKTLVLNTYAMSSHFPSDNASIGFLRFILNEGQAAADVGGLISLVPGERNSKSDLVPYMMPGSKARGINLLQLFVTIALGIALILVIVSLMVRYRRNHGKLLLERISRIKGAFSESGIVIPKGLFFDKTHTWAYMEVNGAVKVGIDDFLQHVTGKLTRIKTKSPGDRVIKGEPILTFIQNGKHLVIKSPVSGIIKAENLLLITDPSLINSAPYTDGWFYEIEPSSWMKETQIMLMADKYSEWIKGEFRRLRDFLASTLKPQTPEYSYVILQDGGEIADNVLANLGPEVWEEFQVRFIDSAN